MIFGSKIIKRISEDNFRNDIIKYNIINNYSKNFLNNNNKKLLELNSYYKLSKYIIEKINIELSDFDNLNLEMNIIKDL